MSLVLSITSLAPGGDGVAIVEMGGERRAVFVRGASVGDRVKVDVDASRRPARGRVLELLEEGPTRVAPACAHVARCGGCDWMHVSLAAQRDAHEGEVRRALPEAWRGVTIVAHDAPPGAALAYRSRARVHVRASGGRAIVGMHEAGSNEPAEVDTCVVLAPELDVARGRVAAFFDGAHGHGDAQLALGSVDGDGARRAVLDLRWSGALPAACFARIERATLAGEWAGARLVQGDTRKPAIIGDPTPWMRGADGAPLRLAAGGFGQASEAANAQLAKRVAELAAQALPPEGSRRVTELYAGAGNLTVLLARASSDVTAVESSRDACDAARANLAARDLRAKVVEADAAAYAWPKTTRLVVLDPPRTGARDVATRLAEAPVRHVIYVSCDPQTLGRDLATLAGAGYAPRAVETFEMFPQTSHVETVVALERTRGRA